MSPSSLGDLRTIKALSDQLNPAGSQWLICDVDLAAVRRVREQGQVFTRRDWPEQFERSL